MASEARSSKSGSSAPTLLETGNWTDKGHPTGRRVTFINSFAIKGQYFNFSTTGQWMWDEIMFSIPAVGNAYAMIELISEAVLKETEQEARLAEEEWKRVTRKNDLSRFTATPAVSLRPGATESRSLCATLRAPQTASKCVTGSISALLASSKSPYRRNPSLTSPSPLRRSLGNRDSSASKYANPPLPTSRWLRSHPFQRRAIELACHIRRVGGKQSRSKQGPR